MHLMQILNKSTKCVFKRQIIFSVRRNISLVYFLQTIDLELEWAMQYNVNC